MTARTVAVIGLGVGEVRLDDRASDALARAELLVGGARQLAAFPGHPARRLPIAGPLARVLDAVAEAVDANRPVAVLADGELLYSKYIPAASLQTLLPYIEKEQLSVGFVGKDFCRFNLINDLSRDFARIDIN